MIKKDKNEGPNELDTKIEVKVVEMLDDDKEKQEKRNNMIVYNVEEAPDSDLSELCCGRESNSANFVLCLLRM